jgi:BirA family biotin operon repressor/biotin-[acetyl-CoA-carboxylase] ligase
MSSTGIAENNSRMQLLEALAEADNSFVPSSHLTEKLGSSRQAVFKLASALREEGIEIEAVPQKGYRTKNLLATNAMSKTFIEFLCKDNPIFHKCIYMPEVDSTQQTIKRLALQNEPEGVIAVTDKQKNGRGRRGRQWEDTGSKNLIFSVLLRPQLNPGEVQLLNLAAGLAVSGTLKNHYDLNAELKWPNDVLINGKKICGILSEAACEADRIYYAITGIGVNVNTSAATMNKNIRTAATSMQIESNRCTARPLLLSIILANFAELIETLNRANGAAELIRLYRNNCNTIGKEVRVIQDSDIFIGRAEDVTEQGALIVSIDGTRKIFAAADVQHLRDI